MGKSDSPRPVVSELREWTIDALIEGLRALKDQGVHGNTPVAVAQKALVRGVGTTGVFVRTWFMLVIANGAKGLMIAPEDVARDVSALKDREGHRH